MFNCQSAQEQKDFIVLDKKYRNLMEQNKILENKYDSTIQEYKNYKGKNEKKIEFDSSQEKIIMTLKENVKVYEDKIKKLEVKYGFHSFNQEENKILAGRAAKVDILELTVQDLNKNQETLENKLIHLKEQDEKSKKEISKISKEKSNIMKNRNNKIQAIKSVLSTVLKE